MDIKAFLKDLKLQVSKPERIENESDTQVSFQYEVTSVSPASIEPYMDDMDFDEISKDLDMDEDLFIDRQTEDVRSELQHIFNKVDVLGQYGDAFLGYYVSDVSLRGISIKEVTLTFEVQAHFDLPVHEMSEGVNQGVQLLGK